MTSAYVSLHDDLTVAQALERIRLEAPDAETIYQIYIVDKQRHLKGTVSLRELMLANPNAVLRDIMVTDVLHARADEDQNEAANQIARYDLLALPIVDDPYFLGISMVSSTRRFCARPSAVSFDCKGRVSAYPTARRRALSIPFASK